jgi:hypothetical protein
LTRQADATGKEPVWQRIVVFLSRRQQRAGAMDEDRVIGSPKDAMGDVRKPKH